MTHPWIIQHWWPAWIPILFIFFMRFSCIDAHIHQADQWHHDALWCSRWRYSQAGRGGPVFLSSMGIWLIFIIVGSADWPLRLLTFGIDSGIASRDLATTGWGYAGSPRPVAKKKRFDNPVPPYPLQPTTTRVEEPAVDDHGVKREHEKQWKTWMHFLSARRSIRIQERKNDRKFFFSVHFKQTFYLCSSFLFNLIETSFGVPNYNMLLKKIFINTHSNNVQ